MNERILMKRVAKIVDKKLQSFTIIELLVALMLSSLVVLISYTFFDIVSKLYLKKQKFYSNITDMSRLHLEMQEEFDKCESVYYYDNNLLFIKPMGDSICYNFNDTYITKQWEDIKDTVFLRSENFLTKYNSEEVDDGPIDEVSFDIIDKGEKFTFSLIKENSPEIKFKNND